MFLQGSRYVWRNTLEICMKHAFWRARALSHGLRDSKARTGRKLVVLFLRGGREATKKKIHYSVFQKITLVYLPEELGNAVADILEPLDCRPQAQVPALVCARPLEHFQMEGHVEWWGKCCEKQSNRWKSTLDISFKLIYQNNSRLHNFQSSLKKRKPSPQWKHTRHHMWKLQILVLKEATFSS